jgi:hypothetical protein
LQTASLPAFLIVGQSLISGNAFTMIPSFGGNNIWSFGDNYIFGNLDNDPALPVIPRK